MDNRNVTLRKVKENVLGYDELDIVDFGYDSNGSLTTVVCIVSHQGDRFIQAFNMVDLIDDDEVGILSAYEIVTD